MDTSNIVLSVLGVSLLKGTVIELSYSVAKDGYNLEVTSLRGFAKPST